MILYGAPGGCSQASHIALIETDLPHRYLKVGHDKRAEDGRDFTGINPKGYTPALELDDGSVLTESLAILAYIADRTGRLLAKDGSDRWRTLEATEFMTTEIHSNFRPFFNPDASAAPEREKGGKMLGIRFATLDQQLGDRPFLIGETMTIADPYLFVMLTWATAKHIPVPDRLGAYAARMKDLASVKKALEVESRP